MYMKFNYKTLLLIILLGSLYYGLSQNKQKTIKNITGSVTKEENQSIVNNSTGLSAPKPLYLSRPQKNYLEIGF